MQKPLAFGLALQILWGGWADSAIAASTTIRGEGGQLTETAIPRSFNLLNRVLDQYQPQIKILSPKAGELLTDNSVNVSFEIKDLPIYKDKTLQLGPHLHLQLDDRPHQSIYDPSASVLLTDLEPGTHTLRLFAATPWDESFKNDGAFAQVTFHIFTKTNDNSPSPTQPLLTYNQPQGRYGAQPILLDFYLTNAPLHLIAQENDSDSIQDWKIKATINGQSFLLDRWQPTYLTGFKPGKNWVQLEFIDQNGNRVENFGNNTARIFTYEPDGQDSLAKLTRGELTIAQSKGIVDPSYTPPAPPKPIEVAPAGPKVEIKSEPKSEVKPEVKPSPAAKSIMPLAKPPSGIVPIPLPQKAPDLKAPIAPNEGSKPEVKPEKAPEAQPKPKKIIQKLLPAFMGPGKKIDVKTPIKEPAKAPLAKPPGAGIVTPNPSTKPPETKIAPAKPIEEKNVAKKSTEPKKENWFDRFRKPTDEKTKPEVKPEVKPTQIPDLSKPAEPKLTDNKSTNSNAKRKPAIEAREPFKFNFGSDKKTEIAPTPESKPIEIKPLAKPPETAIVKPTEPKVNQPKESKKDPQNVPVVIPNRSESPKPLQLTPGEKVEVKKTINPEPKPKIKPEIKSEVKPLVNTSPAPKNQKPNLDSNTIPDLKEVTKPVPIKSIPAQVSPAITPKLIPQSTINPLAKPPLEIAPPTKATTKSEENPEEKPSLEKPNANKYDYLKEYLNKADTTVNPPSQP